MTRGGAPPLVPMWPRVRVVERNPFSFFPFNPRWREGLIAADIETFCTLLKLAWISHRPGFLPPDRAGLQTLLKEACHNADVTDVVLAQYHRQDHTGLLFLPRQVRALCRLVAGEDMYSLLWDDSL